MYSVNGSKKGRDTMSEFDRRTAQILRHEETYRNSPLFKQMVDQTVYLTPEQKEASQLEVDRVYGVDFTPTDETF